MEWIETTGRTIEEARELALDQLGVDESEAEFEVLDEPKTGMFGRPRGIARVRARIVPKAPRAKNERQRRPRKTSSAGDTAPSTAKAAERQGGSAKASAGSKQRTAKRSSNGPKTPDRSDSIGADLDDGGSDGDRPTRGRGSNDRSRSSRSAGNKTAERQKEPMDEAEQISVVEGFLVELASSFGLTATASSSIDDGYLRVNLHGDDLGLLVGPRLATLDAIQEITRTALQRQAEGREYARVRVDVSRIRERRTESLGEFVRKAAERSVDEDVTVVFEVMSSVDRKMVHDVAAEVEGVQTASEGEDPRRRVAIKPVKS